MKKDLHPYEYTRTSDGSKPPGDGWSVKDKITDATGKVHTFWMRPVKRP